MRMQDKPLEKLLQKPEINNKPATKIKSFIWIYSLCGCLIAHGQLSSVSSGVLKHYEKVASKYITARNVDVWLPEDYTPEKKYAMLYIYDA